VEWLERWFRSPVLLGSNPGALTIVEIVFAWVPDRSGQNTICRQCFVNSQLVCLLASWGFDNRLYLSHNLQLVLPINF